MKKLDCYSAFVVMSALRLIPALSIPMSGIVFIILLLNGFIEESVLHFQMSDLSFLGMFIIFGMMVFGGFSVVGSLLKTQIIKEWKELDELFK